MNHGRSEIELDCLEGKPEPVRVLRWRHRRPDGGVKAPVGKIPTPHLSVSLNDALDEGSMLLFAAAPLGPSLIYSGWLPVKGSEAIFGPFDKVAR